MSHKSFLTLVNDLARESGVSGNAQSVSAVTGQSGEANRLVNWIIEAHNDIQNRHQNWRWMRSTFTFDTVVGDGSYAYTDCTDTRLSAAISRFKRWWVFDEQGMVGIKRYLTSGGLAGEIWMVPIPWAYYRSIYTRGVQNNGPVIHVTVDPQNNLLVAPKPDDIYTVSGEYQMGPKVFSADGDTAEFPEEFDDLITYKAMEKYGRYHMASEVLARGQVEGNRLMRQLEASQLPEIAIASPLA